MFKTHKYALYLVCATHRFLGFFFFQWRNRNFFEANNVSLPKHCYDHPVLPVRSRNKLTFPLCAACVKQEQDNPMLERSDVCNHTPEERTLQGTWCTPEIEKAVEKGYRVIKIHEVWHFSQQRDGLFRDYVNTWLKLKQEAAGWPRWCDTEKKKSSNTWRSTEKERA